MDRVRIVFRRFKYFEYGSPNKRPNLLRPRRKCGNINIIRSSFSLKLVACSVPNVNQLTVTVCTCAYFHLTVTSEFEQFTSIGVVDSLVVVSGGVLFKTECRGYACILRYDWTGTDSLKT